MGGVCIFAGLLAGCKGTHCGHDGEIQIQPAGVAGSSPTASVNAFFDVGTTSQDIKLPADQVFPRGRIFPFTYYSTGGGTLTKRGDLLPEVEKRADQKEILDGGATLIGPQYELNDEGVALAREYKKQVVYTICPVVDGKKMIGSKSFDRYHKEPLPRVKIANSIAEQVRAVAGNPEIAWWNIEPEELRSWRKAEMEYLKLATETIRACDPLKRPIMIYDPGHRNAEALAKLAPYLDFIAKGMYTNYAKMIDMRVWARHSTQEAVKARAMVNRPEITVLALPEMFQDPKNPADLAMIPVWVRHDVYSALVAGAQGVAVFSASKRPNFESRQVYLDAYKTVATELTGKMDLGTMFLFGKRMSDLSFQTISGPENVTLVLNKKDLIFPAVDMANIAFNHLRYVVVVNSSGENVNGMVHGLPYGDDVMVRNLWNGRPAWAAPEGEFEVELPPWGVQAFVVYRAQ